MDGFLFVELAGLTPGKPFAGFAAGSFVDMNGRAVEFTAGSLRTFIANTLKAIKAAREKGMPGLPIDARSHDKGEAAGWIVGAEGGEVVDSGGGKVPVIMLAAEWTKVGLELLRERIMANFSPTVDVRGKVIRGGSLTNWPASVDASGAPLFPAVELAQGMWAWRPVVELAEQSLEERAQAVREAWRSVFPVDEGEGPQMWVVEVFEEHLVVNVAGRFYQVAWAQDEDGNTGFAPQEEWVEVEKAWVETEIGRALTEAELGGLPGGAAMVSVSGSGETGRESKQDEVVDMNMTKEELAALVGDQVRAALAAELQQVARPAGAQAGAASPAQEGKAVFDVLDFLEMGEATDDVVGAFKKQMLDQYELMKQRAATEAAEMIGRIRREADIAEFAQGVTGGTAEVPFGLPVAVGDLKEFLGRLQPTDLEFAKKLLGDIQTHGRQKFGELGHGKTGQTGGEALPAVYAEKLSRGELTVADLSAPELALGDLARYDLSRWNGGK